MSIDNSSQTGLGTTGALWTGTATSPGFSLAVSPASRSIDPGSSAVYTVSVASTGGFAGTVVLSVSGLPPGVIATFSPSSIAGSGTATLTLATSDSVAAGSYTVTVTGTSGSSHSATAALVIRSVALGQIQVLVDGLDRTNYIQYGASFDFQGMRQQRGSSAVPFIIPPGSAFAPQTGQVLDIWDQGHRVWAGTVDQVSIKWIGDDGWHQITVTGVTLEALFDGAIFDKLQYSNETPHDIVVDLFGRAALPFVGLGFIDTGSTALLTTVDSLSVTNFKNALDTLCSMCGYIWYVDPRDKLLYFHLPSTRPADWIVIDGDILYETIAWKQSRQDFADTQLMQLPGIALAPQTSSFAGDGATTIFTLPQIPQFVESADVQPYGGGTNAPLPQTIAWVPGSDKISCSPAMRIGDTLVVVWTDPGLVSSSSPAFGGVVGGSRSRLSNLTRAFTAAGALQQAAGALAQYAQLPSSVQFDTDKPGIAVGRILEIAIGSPVEAGDLLNGNWQVVEVEARIVDGLDQRAEPWGHFRYTLYLVNFAATAIYAGSGPGTGGSATYTLPVVPTAITGVRVSNSPLAPAAYSHSTAGADVTVSPAPPSGATVQIGYTTFPAPGQQTYQQTMQGLAPAQGGTIPGPSSNSGTVPNATNNVPMYFWRTLTLRDLTVGNDIAPAPCAMHPGIGSRILIVVKKVLTADLDIRINMNGAEIISFTVPAHYALESTLVIPLVTGSPAIATPIPDLAVFTADILSSDGQIVTNPQDCVAQVTIEWEYD